MRLNTFILIIKLSATPPSIIYPIPILALLAFSLSNHSFYGLLLAIAFTFTSQAGINLWNHINDVEEDKLAGKINILIESETVRKYTILLVIILYFISFALVVLFSHDVFSIPVFFVVVLVTWVYSDKIFLGKFIRRWKDNYKTEILTYIISAPLYSLVVWSFFEKINCHSFAFAAIFSSIFLSGLFLKDIKDTSSDELAGLRTLAVVFTPSKLLKLFFTFIWLYYFFIVVSCLSGLIQRISIFAVFPSVFLLYSNVFCYFSKWKVDLNTVKFVKIAIYSSLLSLTLLILLNLINLFQV